MNELLALDPELHTRLLADLAEWSRRPTPRIVVVGEYSSGKTSLLKRLRAELGGVLPEGARVAADPATDTVGFAQIGPHTLVDTPGVGGGVGSHYQRAMDAALLADALLITLPPALFTGDSSAIRSLLDGSAWAGAAPPVLLVVTNADRLGVSPIDDEAGFRRVCARKCEELESRLAHWKVPTNPPLFIAADPSGVVGDQADATVGDYLRRPWDGVKMLVASLVTLSERGAAARPAARKRHIGRLVHERALALRSDARKASAAANELDLVTPMEGLPELAGIVAGEREELRALLHGAAEPVVRRVHAGESLGDAELLAALADIEPVLDAWRDKATARLNAAMGDQQLVLGHGSIDEVHWDGASGDRSVDPWTKHAPLLERILKQAGKSLHEDPDKLRGRVDDLYAWMKWKAKPWEKVKITGRAAGVGKGLGTAAGHAAAALSLVDDLRGWMAESRNAATRARADQGLRMAVDGVAQRVLDGSSEAPGLDAWWRDYQAAALTARAATEGAVRVLRGEAKQLEVTAAALEDWVARAGGGA